MACPEMHFEFKASVKLLLLLLSVCCESNLAFGQSPKVPEVGYVFPPVVKAGASTSVMMGGFDWTPDMQWFVHHESVRLDLTGAIGDYHLPPPPYWTGPRAGTNAPPIPREVSANLLVDSSVEEGIVRWQVANANGASDTGVIFVSRGEELIESRSRDLAMDIASLPVGISGRLSRLTEVDSYRFVAGQTGFVTADLMARRLGADFNGAIEVTDESGQIISDFFDTSGLDGSLTFPVASGKPYTVRIRDTDFRGDRSYVYRLGLTYGPKILGLIPSAAQHGTTGPVRIMGIGLKATNGHVDDAVLQATVPAENSSLHLITLGSPFGDMKATMPLSPFPQHIAADGDSVQVVTPPVGISGIFHEEFRRKNIQWSSLKDERWSVEAESRSLNSRMDVSLEILGADEQPLANSDDVEGTTDARLEFQTPSDGMLTAIVRGVPVNPTQKVAVGNSLDQFRVTIRKAESDFELVIPSRLSIGLGDKAELPIQVVRHGGFSSPIQLQVSDLPDGVTPVGDLIIPPAVSDFKLPLQCAPDIATTAKVVHVIGTSMIGEQQVMRKAIARAAGNLCPKHPEDARTDGTLLAITMKAPFALQVVDRERQHDVHRGTTFLAELDVVRNNGFSGDLRIEMSAKQDRVRMGVRGGIQNVSASETKVFYPVFMPEWLSTDLTRRIVVHGVTVIPDPKGHLRHVTNAADARITMIMEGALLKLSAKSPETSFRPGDVVEIPVQISRSPKLALPATVRLEVPEELSESFTARNSGWMHHRTPACWSFERLNQRCYPGRGAGL